MEWLIVIELIASLLAVIGIYLFVRYMLDVYFMPKEVVTVITIFDSESRENVDLLLDILRRSTWNQINKPIMVLISKKYSEDRELLGYICKADIEYRIVED